MREGLLMLFEKSIAAGSWIVVSLSVVQTLVLGTRRLIFAHCKQFLMESVELHGDSHTGYPC